MNQIIPDPNVSDESNFCGYITPDINLGNIEEYLELNDNFWCFGEQSLLEQLQKENIEFYNFSSSEKLSLPVNNEF